LFVLDALPAGVFFERFPSAMKLPVRPSVIAVDQLQWLVLFGRPLGRRNFFEHLFYFEDALFDPLLAPVRAH